MPSGKPKKRQTKNSGGKKTPDEVVETQKETNSMSSYLGDDITVGDENGSICSETLLCLEDVCCESIADNPASIPPLEPLTSDMSRTSLIVGSGADTSGLRQQIGLLTKDHEVQTCQVDGCFDMCNKQNYLLIWVDMPVLTSHEILSMTSSIRYASKYNKSTVIIGVTSISTSADLRLHGIDEILVKPISSKEIQEKYSKWTSVQLASKAEDNDFIEFDDKVLSTPSTPHTPATPATPCTPASVNDETDRASFSLSIDSGIESPSPATPVSIHTLAALNEFTPTSIYQPSVKQTRQQAASDHTAKEKMRRERIKDSCDQLRVLLPYIRGRKTDMASILEMCVEYLKIVNAALPHGVQNQIIEILSKDTVTTSPKGVKNSVRKMKRDRMQAAAMQASVSSAVTVASAAGKPTTNTFAPSLMDKPRCELPPQMKIDNFISSEGSLNPDNDKKRDLVKSELDFQQHKRFRLHSPPGSFSSLPPSPSGSSSVNDQQAPFIHITPHTSLYSDVDTSNARMFPNHVFQDGFSSTSGPYYNSPLNKKPPGGLDRDPYGVFLDAHIYQYYGNYNLGPVGDLCDS